MDEFLGPTGAATIVLLKLAQDEKPPSIKNLKSNLDVAAVKYYKGDGWYRNGIRMLEQLLRILKTPNDPVHYWISLSCTDFLHLDPNVNQHPFYEIKYSNITIAGFNLTNQCMNELEKLLRIRSDLCSMQESVKNFQSKIEFNIEFAKVNSIDDTSMIDPNLDLLKKMLENYGNEGLQIINSRLAEWHQKYKWKGANFQFEPENEELVTSDTDEENVV